MNSQLIVWQGGKGAGGKKKENVVLPTAKEEKGQSLEGNLGEEEEEEGKEN